MAIDKGSCAKIYGGVTTGPSAFVEHINNISLSLDGKPVDVTEFSAAACTAGTAFTQKMNSIKEMSLSISGFADLTATVQAMLWANYVSEAELWIKVGFGAAGAGPTLNFRANINNVKLDATPDNFQQVSFDISNYGTITVA